MPKIMGTESFLSLFRNNIQKMSGGSDKIGYNLKKMIVTMKKY